VAKKILIVEDDKMLCTIFEMFIKQSGYELTGISHSGAEAINLCVITKPDVVLMDIHLTGDIDGVEAAIKIHHSFDVPVIYLTSDIEEPTIKKAIYKNTYGFLMKPIYQSALRVAIEYAIAKHAYDKKGE